MGMFMQSHNSTIHTFLSCFVYSCTLCVVCLKADLIPGEASPMIASILRGEHLGSPGSARRQLFSPGGRKPTTPIKLLPSSGTGTPTRPIPIAPKPAGGVTVTLLRDFLQQQQGSINQQLGASPAKSGGGSPGRFDPSSPLKVVSMASAGTQTSPCRPFTSASLTAANFTSPPRNISISTIAQVCNGLFQTLLMVYTYKYTC